MAKRRSGRQKPDEKPESHDLKAVLGLVRSIWTAVDGADPRMQAWLRARIVSDLQKLNKQVEGKLKLASLATQKQPRLFPDSDTPQKSAQPPNEKPRFPEPCFRLYAKDFSPHALVGLPQASRFHDIESFREHLSKTLRFNSVATRRRAANYLIARFFPGGHLHRDLAEFAAAASGQLALADTAFYLTCRTEKIVAMTAESVVWPSLADGGVPRKRIVEFVSRQFPDSKSARQVATAIMRTYDEFGVGESTRTRLNISQRPGNFASFIYLMHLEYPEPGMYSFDSLLDGPLHKWLLWEKEWMIEQLYACRQEGLLTKISEIDAMRQFTTKYPLAEAVDRLVPLMNGGES